MLEMFFLGLGLTVTEITIKKVQKQDLKNINNVKKSPIPTSFYIRVNN